MAKLCEVCSNLDTQGLTHHLHPCRNPLSCSTPPIDSRYLLLGSVDEIKRRRSTCDICGLIAEGLDNEPSDLDGECRLRESAEFCIFKLPSNIKPRDPSITHFHLTQASVVFDTSEANRFNGPALPWEIKLKDARSTHFVLNFQVKAKKSNAAAADSPMTAPQTEEEFLDTIGGRYVSAQTNAQLIHTWLHQCEKEHGGECMPYLRLSAAGNREPAFVVDVIDSCLVDTPQQCRYVALSYVWGLDPVFTHRVENTKDLRTIGSLLSLPIPSTIRDAIILVHAIGERYLWVDSLCIIQDDWRMKDAEILRMGWIYSRALFTIIAAAGNHANSGLPGVGTGTRGELQKIIKLANCELLTVIDICNTPNRIDGTAWAQRAWTFQERILSNRVLVFSENQVFWSCRAASHSEERALEEVQDVERYQPSFPQTTATDSLSWRPVQLSEYCNVYDDLISTYRQRHLRFQADLLNAFNGVSETLAAIQDDRFLWGLPESLFSYAMTWSFTGHSARNHVDVPFESNGSKQMIPIPSWSWAAWSGKNPDNLPFLHGGYGAHVRPVIRFYIVDRNNQLVRVKEQSWPDHPGDRIYALWKNEQLPLLQSRIQHDTLRTGQLHFWTSFANVWAIRSWRVDGPGAVTYTLFPPPDFQPNLNSTHYHTEIVHQDFIVVAVSGPTILILLAIEWKDGVAYRVGSSTVKEAEWLQVENRQWRLITLG